MPYVPGPGIVQVAQYFSGPQGVTASNIWHVFSPTPWTTSRLADLEAVFAAWENPTGANRRCIEVACTGFRLTDLTSLASPMIFVPHNILGLKNVPAAPANSTIAIKLDTGLRGRGRNGRVFWFGVAEEDVDIGEIHSGESDDIIAAVDQLIVDVGAFEDAVLCVMHTQRDNVPLNPFEQSAVLRAAITDKALDSQRDRLPGHKRRKRT